MTTEAQFGWQVTLSTSDGRPATDLAEALQALSACGQPQCDRAPIEPVWADQGCWLATLTADAATTVEVAGWLVIEAGGYRLEAEYPE